MNTEISSFAIPYRLETPEAVTEAIKGNFLKIGPPYKRMLTLAQRHPLCIPPALENARKSVEKDFSIVREDKTRECNVRYSEIADLDLVNNFCFIEKALPWVKDLAQQENLFALMGSLSQTIQRLCLPSPVSATITSMYESSMAIRKLIRYEILTYIRSRKTKYATMEELKKLVTAYAIHDTKNEDIFHALRMSASSSDPLYQNALAELLFCRLKDAVDEFTKINPVVIRQKLFSWIAKLAISSRQKSCLYGYFKMDAGVGDIIPSLRKMDAVAGKIFTDGTRARFHDYITSLNGNMEKRKNVYRELFLAGDLEQMQKLHVPGRVMKYEITYTDRIIKKYTRSMTLRFYPTKDYLDFCKGDISRDCAGIYLGEKHLLTPNFFNIRIFQGTQWIGNIYMLDFTQEYNVLLIDRIQIPRDVNAGYINFFGYLKEVFEEMFFVDVLVPLVISNHDAIQKAFNRYKDKLPKRSLKIESPHTEHFESLKYKKNYYVFCERKESLS